MDAARHITASDRHRQRLARLKHAHWHLDQSGKGLMIDDPDLVECIVAQAVREGISKREGVTRAPGPALAAHRSMADA